MVRNYYSADGIHGYREGDILVCIDTGECTRVVRDGRGLCLVPHIAPDSRPPATVYVGESPADLSVYAAPGWDAWMAMWSLIAEWTNDPLAELAHIGAR